MANNTLMSKYNVGVTGSNSTAKTKIYKQLTRCEFMYTDNSPRVRD